MTTADSVILRYLKLVTAIVFVMLAFILWQSYQGRVDLVSSQRRGCERGKIDRTQNAKGWRAAMNARTATAQDRHATPSERVSALHAAQTYQQIVQSLESRTGDRLDCHSAFPNASLLP